MFQNVTQLILDSRKIQYKWLRSWVASKNRFGWIYYVGERTIESFRRIHPSPVHPGVFDLLDVGDRSGK